MRQSYSMSVLNLSRKSPILLIDTSYYIFNRFHATARWYSFKEPTANVAELTEDPVYLEAFFKHHQKDMKTLLKKHKILPQNVLWCLDAPRQTIWRMAHHTEYKGTREHSKFDGRIFPLFYKHLTEQGARQIQCSSLEADDIVALIHEKVGDHPMLIITNDNDYLQLCRPTTQIMNMQGKDLATRGTGDPQKDVMIKILMGDKSDNIPPVFAKCGVKTAQEVASLSEEERMEFIKAKNAIEQYHKNKMLICFSSIPEALREQFSQLYKIEFNSS